MEFLDNIANVGVGVAVGGIIAFTIQVIKAIFQKLPWSWAKKIPSAVWIVLSVALGIGVAFYMNYNVIDEVLQTPLPVSDTFKVLLTGIGLGGSSKVVYDVATPLGAKLDNITKENKVEEPAKEVAKEQEKKFDGKQEIPEILSQTYSVNTVDVDYDPKITRERIVDDVERVVEDYLEIPVEKGSVVMIKRYGYKSDMVIVNGKVYTFG